VLFYIVEMIRPDYLGQFEQLVLLALLRLGDDAYGMSIRREIVDRTGRDVAIGAVYATLDRLREKGYISAKDGAATAERGGRPKRFFKIEGDGVSALKDAREHFNVMADGLALRSENSCPAGI